MGNMILIKDRHNFWASGINKLVSWGNMILIKDRHGCFVSSVPSIVDGLGNMILIKDRHSKPEPMFIASI